MTDLIPIRSVVVKGRPIAELFGGMTPIILHADGTHDELVGLHIEPDETTEDAIRRRLKPDDRIYLLRPGVTEVELAQELIKAQLK